MLTDRIYGDAPRVAAQRRRQWGLVSRALVVVDRILPEIEKEVASSPSSSLSLLSPRSPQTTYHGSNVPVSPIISSERTQQPSLTRDALSVESKLVCEKAFSTFHASYRSLVQLRYLFVLSLLSIVCILITVICTELLFSELVAVSWLPVLAVSIFVVLSLPFCNIVGYKLRSFDYHLLSRTFLISHIISYLMWQYTDSVALQPAMFALSPAVIITFSYVLEGNATAVLITGAGTFSSQILIAILAFSGAAQLSSSNSIAFKALAVALTESLHMHVMLLCLFLMVHHFRAHQLAEAEKGKLALYQLMQRYEQTTVNKQLFLSAITHDVYKPVNSILDGLSSVMQESSSSNLTTAQRDDLAMCSSSAHSISSLLRDILDLFQLDTHHLKFDVVEFDVHELVDTVLRSFTSEAQRCNIQLLGDVASGISPRLRGDPFRLSQILNKLLANAIQSCSATDEEAFVKLKCEAVKIVQILPSSSRMPVLFEVLEFDPAAASGEPFALSFPVRSAPSSVAAPLLPAPVHCHLHFTIEDSGVGVTEEQLEQITERFRKADHNVAATFSGAMMGLSICAGLVKLFNGHIWMTSQRADPERPALAHGTHAHFIARFDESSSNSSSAAPTPAKLQHALPSATTHVLTTPPSSLLRQSSASFTTKTHNSTPHYSFMAELGLSWMHFCVKYVEVLVCIKAGETRRSVQHWMEDWQHQRELLYHANTAELASSSPAFKRPLMSVVANEGELMASCAALFTQCAQSLQPEAISVSSIAVTVEKNDADDSESPLTPRAQSVSATPSRILLVMDDFSVDATASSSAALAARQVYVNRNRRATKFLRLIQSLMAAKKVQHDFTIDVIWLISPGAAAMPVNVPFHQSGVITNITRSNFIRALDACATGLDSSHLFVSGNANFLTNSNAPLMRRATSASSAASTPVGAIRKVSFNAAVSTLFPTFAGQRSQSDHGSAQQQ